MAASVDALVSAIGDLEAVDLSPVLRSHMPRFFTHPEFHVVRCELPVSVVVASPRG
jgi:hypothetical protein